jgi:uncharacterized protein (TIGR03437 family)
MVTESQGASRQAESLGAAPTQRNFVVPPETAAGPAQVTIASSTGAVWIAPAAPGLFSMNANGLGPAAAYALRVRADGAQTTEPTFHCAATCVNLPLDLGPVGDQVYLQLYGTGLRHSAAPPLATIGGERVEVLYAGPQSAFPGLDQLNLRVPRTLAGRGELPVVLVTAGKVSNPVTVSFK